MSENNTFTSRKALLGYVIVLVAVVTVGAGVLFSQPSEAIPTYNIDGQEVAIKGYDTVAFFTESKALKGSGEFTSKWEDAIWHFASASNRDLFDANPKRYAPQYGGYCALGIAAGEFADIDPEAWTIVEGKLYFNYNKEFRDDVWRESSQAYLVTAEYNWDKNRDKLRDNR